MEGGGTPHCYNEIEKPSAYRVKSFQPHFHINMMSQTQSCKTISEDNEKMEV